MQNRDCFWEPFGSERVNEAQNLVKSAEKYFYPTFSSLWANLKLKKLILIRSEILGLLVNTVTANCQYSPSNRENLLLQIQIKLIKKPSKFFCIFFYFLESTLNFQCSEKKMSMIVGIFRKLLTPKDVLVQMHNRDSFWKPTGSEHVNESRKLVKSAEKYFYPTFSSF